MTNHIKMAFYVPIMGIMCGVAFILYGCEMATGNVGAGDNTSIREIERSITDLENKLTELTREVAQLDNRVARVETALDAYASDVSRKTVEEEAVDEKAAGADKGVTPGIPDETTPEAERGGVTFAAEPDTKGTGPEKTEALPPSTTTLKDAQALYNRALGEIMDRRAETALILFGEFVASYPNDELTDNAYYWIGECYYVSGDYPQALAGFKKVKDDFPDKDKVPDALLKMGYCYEKLGDGVKARESYTELITMYPDNPATDLARERLK